MKKIISIFLVIALTCGSLLSVVSANSNNDAKAIIHDEIFLDFEGHGSFKSNLNKGTRSLDQASYRAVKKHGDLYEIVNPPEDFPFKLIMKVKEDTYLAVAEQEVTTKNIQSVMTDNRITDQLKKDVQKLMKEIEERKLRDTTVTIYSPNLIPVQSRKGAVTTSSWTPQYTSYYTGYNGYSYQDEWYYISNYSPVAGTQNLTPYAAAQDFYNRLFQNGMITGFGFIQFAWIPITLYGLFGADTIIGGNTNDKLVITWVESKYRKYTSISWLGAWRFKAVTDLVYSNTTNFQKISNGTITNEQRTFSNVPTSSWSIPDQRAYQMRDSMTFWDEKIYNYRFFDLYFAAP